MNVMLNKASPPGECEDVLNKAIQFSGLGNLYFIHYHSVSKGFFIQGSCMY